MLEISDFTLLRLSENQRNKQFPLMCEKILAAFNGEAGRLLSIPHALHDKQHIVNLVSQAEALGLDGDNDIVAFGLLKSTPDINLPLGTRDWIEAILITKDATWPEKLDAINAMLPEPHRTAVFSG